MGVREPETMRGQFNDHDSVDGVAFEIVQKGLNHVGCELSMRNVIWTGHLSEAFRTSLRGRHVKLSRVKVVA